MTADQDNVQFLVQKVIEDIGAVFHAPLVLIGEKLGLFKAMAESGPVSAKDLAEATGTIERYVSEWLAGLASGGYVTYDPETGRFSLSEAQALVLADPESPVYMAGAFQAATAAIKSEPKVAEAFRTGRGVCWSEHAPEFYQGADNFYRPNYVANLVQAWIPALDGVAEKLAAGGAVADVGCGYGTSTILMARGFPASTFLGIDFHEPSIAAARSAAARAGLDGRISFQVCKAEEMEISDRDLVTTFDCLHDMGDPLEAARRIRAALKADGTWMIVEPRAGDRMEENFNPVGRLYYCASVLLCTPSALAQDDELTLGGQAGEARIKRITEQAGFTRFRRVIETPINMIFEVRL